MKILHTITSLNTNRGGPPRSTVELCRALAAAGHDVTILTQDVSGWPEESLTYSSDNCGRLDTICGRSIYLTGRRIIRDFDIVSLQSVWSPQNALLAHYCTKRNIPYVLVPRGELDVWSMRQKAWKKRLYLSVVGRKIIRNAAALHFLNDPEVRGTKQLRLEGRYFVAPNGIDGSEWADLSSQGEFRLKNPHVGDKIIILFMGRLHPKKGASLLATAFIELARKYRETYLLICGPDFGERELIERILTEPEIDGRAKCLGMVSGVERQQILSDADIIVLPSYQEGHPRIVLEAAYLGKAMVITPACHCPEFVDGESAIVADTNVESIARGLEKLILDADLRHRLAAKASIIVRERFVWERIAEQTAMSYDSCLSATQRLRRM